MAHRNGLNSEFVVICFVFLMFNVDRSTFSNINTRACKLRIAPTGRTRTSSEMRTTRSGARNFNKHLFIYFLRSQHKVIAFPNEETQLLEYTPSPERIPYTDSYCCYAGRRSSQARTEINWFPS